MLAHLAFNFRLIPFRFLIEIVKTFENGIYICLDIHINSPQVIIRKRSTLFVRLEIDIRKRPIQVGNFLRGIIE